MGNSTIPSCLHEVAIEMAFLLPAQPDGLKQVSDLLAQWLRESTDTATSEALARCIALCQQGLASQEGLTQAEIDHLQATVEKAGHAHFLKPVSPALAPKPTENASATDQREEALVLNLEGNLEFFNEFCNEGRDLLVQVEQAVLVLEENPRHKETLNTVFRAFHTLKGNAGFLGLSPVQNLAHHIESVLDAARQDKLNIHREVIELILAGADALQLYVQSIDRQVQGEDRGQGIVVPTASLIAKAQAFLHGQVGQASAPTPPTEPTEPTASTTVPSEPTEPPSVQAAAAPEHDPPASHSREKDAQPTHPPAPAKATRENALAHFVKLDTRKLDALVDLVGELVIAQSMVAQNPAVLTQQDRTLERHLRQLSRITTDLQHNAMSLRIVPIRTVMQKMVRLVRDLSASQNKQVQLHLSGEETELDRKIVEELADPLLHMMRNAIDHGIETPAQRQAQGKSAQGNIHLQASHQGGGILISIRDDGQGLDPKKILNKALQRGLIAPESELSEKDIYNLIFLPGFSTATAVTEISGRGVGMDVVRGSINKLRGRVDIESVQGQGTTFNIFLPLTLAIIDAMLVGVGQQRFILPTLTIRESLRPQADMVHTVQGQGEIISVRGKLIPLIRLADKLGLPSQAHHPSDGIVVVVDSGKQQRALLVDSLMGKQEVVIKSLGNPFKHQQGISGAAILGDGHVALIVDPDAIGRLTSIADPVC